MPLLLNVGFRSYQNGVVEWLLEGAAESQAFRVTLVKFILRHFPETRNWKALAYIELLRPLIRTANAVSDEAIYRLLTRMAGCVLSEAEPIVIAAGDMLASPEMADILKRAGNDELMRTLELLFTAVARAKGSLHQRVGWEVLQKIGPCLPPVFRSGCRMRDRSAIARRTWDKLAAAAGVGPVGGGPESDPGLIRVLRCPGAVDTVMGVCMGANT
jgi:hypothetical protein